MTTKNVQTTQYVFIISHYHHKNKITIHQLFSEIGSLEFQTTS